MKTEPQKDIYGNDCTCFICNNIADIDTIQSQYDFNRMCIYKRVEGKSYYLCSNCSEEREKLINETLDECEHV